MSHPPRAQAAASYFALQAPRYRSTFPGPLARWVRARESRAVLAALGDVRDRDVLELGCGDGHYARALHAAGARTVVAVDLVPEMVARLPSDGVVGVVGDAAALDLGLRFPALVSAGMLEFVDDPAAILRNAARHAEPGARLVVLAPTADAPGAVYAAWHRSHGVRVHLFTRARLEALGRGSGWTPVAHTRAALFAHVVAFERRDG